jgi:hypothetical protein
VVGDKSSALDGAGSPFHFEALFSFLRAVVGFNLRCLAAAGSTESDSRRRCPRDARRWLRTALAIVMLGSACCISTAQGTWSTAQLSLARSWLAATSVGNVAIFAGGMAAQGGNCSLTLFVQRLVFGLTSIGDGVTFACFEACGLLFVVYVVQEVAVSWGSLQVEFPTLWTCTTVHRAHGRLRSSVRRAKILLRHLLGTWPSSRGVTEVNAV